MTLTGEGEHRLSLDLIARVRCALGRVRAESVASPFSALVTRAEGKYFSNGFDLDYVNETKSSANQLKRGKSLTSGLASITADLMSLQMPTICAVTGDASAVGFMLAFSHDYVAMHGDNGFLCMSELSNLLSHRHFLSLMKAKVRDDEVFKELVLRSRKIPAMEAMDRGVIDLVGETATETVEEAVKLGHMLAKKNWNGKVYASLRKEAFPEICRAVGIPGASDKER